MSLTDICSQVRGHVPNDMYHQVKDNVPVIRSEDFMAMVTVVGVIENSAGVERKAWRKLQKAGRV